MRNGFSSQLLVGVSVAILAESLLLTRPRPLEGTNRTINYKVIFGGGAWDDIVMLSFLFVRQCSDGLLLAVNMRLQMLF